MLPLIGILIVIAGFALRVNPLAVVTAAALATGLAAHRTPVEVIAAFGKAFIDSRSVPVVWLALPVIGLLESAGLKERALRAGAAALLDKPVADDDLMRTIDSVLAN